MQEFQYDLLQEVTIDQVCQHGVVVGRSEYIDETSQYLVRHVDGDGNLVRRWYNATDLVCDE